MRVVIVGAGIGGLALAQALVQRGVDVSLHDRDRDLSVTGGYRLHLDRHACAALRRHYRPLSTKRSSRARPVRRRSARSPSPIIGSGC